MDMINGRNYKLKLGWCAVKNRSNLEMDQTIAWARKNEMKYWSETAPFDREIHINPQNFGSIQLAKRLQPLLNEICKKALPEIDAKINEMLEKTHE